MMGRTFIVYLLFAINGALSVLSAQERKDMSADSIVSNDIQMRNKSARQKGDTTTWIKDGRGVAAPVKLKTEFKPSSKKALLYSLIPGGGQIYNRKYWKLPIVYGGYLGLTYAITWNGSKYNDYSKAYKSIMTGTNDWSTIFPSYDSSGWTTDQLASSFKRQRDYFRRNRDLAIIATVGVYALCMIDAYVDAELYDFDISPDLSLRVEPIISGPTQYMPASFGLQCSLTF